MYLKCIERKPVAIMRRLTRLGLHSPRSGGDDGKAAKARLSWHTNRPNPASLRRKATNLCLESNQQRSGMAQHRGLTHFGVSPFERNNRTQQCAWADRDTIERRCKRICRTKSVCWGSALRKVFWLRQDYYLFFFTRCAITLAVPRTTIALSLSLA